MKSKIAKLVLFFCLGAMLLAACSHPSDLEGTWVGCDIRNPLIDWTLTVLGNQFYLVREDLSMWYVGQFSLNNNCSLKKIDLKFSHTHNQVHNGTIRLGIYTIEENSLTLITSRPGSQLRPTSFDDYGQAVVFNFVRS